MVYVGRMKEPSALDGVSGPGLAVWQPRSNRGASHLPGIAREITIGIATVNEGLR